MFELHKPIVLEFQDLAVLASGTDGVDPGFDQHNAAFGAPPSFEDLAGIQDLPGWAHGSLDFDLRHPYLKSPFKLPALAVNFSDEKQNGRHDTSHHEGCDSKLALACHGLWSLLASVERERDDFRRFTLASDVDFDIDALAGRVAADVRHRNGFLQSR